MWGFEIRAGISSQTDYVDSELGACCVMGPRFFPLQVRLNTGSWDTRARDEAGSDCVAEVHELTGCIGRQDRGNATRTLVGFLDDLHRSKLHLTNQRQTEMLDEQLGDFRFRKIRTWKIEPESLGGQPAAVGKRNVGIEVGAVLGHDGAV